MFFYLLKIKPLCYIHLKITIFWFYLLLSNFEICKQKTTGNFWMANFGTKTNNITFYDKFIPKKCIMSTRKVAFNRGWSSSFEDSGQSKNFLFSHEF